MCRVIKDYGVVASAKSKELKLQTITNLKKEKRLALVSYKDGMSVNITDITIEAKELKRLLEEYLDYKTPEKKPLSEIVKSLTSLPATDINYQTALRDATKEDLTEALKLLQNGSKNATRIKACTTQLNKLNKLYSKPQKGPENKAEDKPKAKIYQFVNDEKRPKIIPLKTEGNHTYEECLIKLGNEAKIFRDSDSQYVIQGLKELCLVDQDFRNNVMREDKSYGGFMEYMEKAARNGYCIKYGNVGWIDRDLGLGLAIDYFNNDEAAKKEADNEKNRKKKGRTAS